MKPALPRAAAVALIGDAMGSTPRVIEGLVEGMESQAFRFQIDGAWFVLRINPSLRGFQKDAWATSAIGERIPVPRVVALGEVDDSHAYCISEWLPGATLEDLPVADATALLDEVARVWRLIATTDVSAINGFGDFDPGGGGPAGRWRDVLEKTLEDARRDLSHAMSEEPADFGQQTGSTRLVRTRATQTQNPCK